MTEQPAKPPSRPCRGEAKRRRSLLVLPPSLLRSYGAACWSVALGLLLAAGLFCWKVASPYLQVRAALDRWETYGSFTADLQRKEIERLGGPEAAAREAR